MDFRIAAVFNRCVTIELCNDSIYRLDEPVEVVLTETGESAESGNHRSAACPVEPRILRTVRNVFSVDALEPDHSYRIEIQSPDGQKSEKIFTTRTESVFLDVRAFGAAGDGEKLDTAAIQAAILACPEDGTVYIPRGTWRTTPLFLKRKRYSSGRRTETCIRCCRA